MKRARKARWVTILLVAGIVLLGAVSAWATDPVHNVNTDEYFDTIQAAINKAGTGDIINVAAGTYAEYLHVTTDNLTIQGAGIDQSIIDLDGLIPYWHYETNKSFASRAGVLITGCGSTDEFGDPDEVVEGVTFKGFTVQNAGLNPPTTATGTYTGEDDATTLTDSSASWETGELVGQWVFNVSDKVIKIDISGNQPIRSYGLITGNTDTTVTATLDKGLDNDWDDGDTYVILPYEEYVDVAEDLQDDVRGISIGNGKDISILDCKVINSGYAGITVGKARLTNLKQSEAVTIDHCIVSGHPSRGISVGDYIGPVTITNNVCSNNGSPHPTDPSREYIGTGISVNGKKSSLVVSGGVISGNECHDNSYHGITLTGYVNGITVEDNIVTGSNLDEDGAGIFAEGKWGSFDKCHDIIIRDNIVTGNIRGIIVYNAQNCTIGGDSAADGNTVTTDSGAFDSGQAAIKLDNAYNTVVKNNTISSLCDGVGIRVTSCNSATLSHDNTIISNTITDAKFAGVRITNGAYDNTFTDNTIQDADFLAFYISSSGNNTFTRNTVNSATLAVFGIREAGTGCTFDGNIITSTPWLWYTNLHIQSVLDNFVNAGDSLYVASGTYAETVTLDKNNLTVSGDAASRPAITGGIKLWSSPTGVTLKNFNVSGVAASNSVVRMLGAVTNLSVDNCVFDGQNNAGRLGFSGGQLEGNVTIQNCEFKNILGSALFESRSGSGGDGSAMGTVTFANNYIHNSNGSVVLRGLSTDRTDIVNVYGNIWKNIGGANGEQGQQWAGLEVNRSKSVNIYNNDVSNVSEGQWGEGQGFQLWNIDTLSLHHNNVTSNFEGIFVFGGDGSAMHPFFAVPSGSLRYNNISGNTEYGVKVDAAATGGPLDAALNWWGSVDGPKADENADGTLEYDGGGDKVIGAVVYSPWLGIGTDAEPGTVGWQPVSPMLIIVAPAGPEPTGGYLKAAIDAANSATLPGTDTIEVKHGIYTATTPITDGVNIVSEPGSAAHTTLTGDMTLDSSYIVLGRRGQGFTVLGTITVPVGTDASTIRANWNNLLGALVNKGTGAVDATLNYWGDPNGPSAGDAVGAVAYSPWLGLAADDSPMLFVVAPVGSKPAAGYLNTAIAAANDLSGTDTIEVKHGTYTATTPITQAVNIVSETGSAAHTTLNGDMTLGSSYIVLGRRGQGFTVLGTITVPIGIDASTIQANWNNLLGALVNGGTGMLDATLNYWGDANGPSAGDAVGAVAYSPWLGLAADDSPMLFVVAPVGSEPAGGYLNTAIAAANDLPGTDTIEVRHGTYDGSEPITEAVNIVSETGSASHTTVNGNVSINGNGVLVGLPLQGFRMNGNVTVGAGNDAATSWIRWSDLYGNVTNNGTGTFDAQYNYWGTQEVAVVDGRTTGDIDYDPFLPKNADDSYVDATAIINAGLASGIDPAIDQLWLMVRLGQDVGTFIQYQGVAGAGAFAGAPAGAQINLGGAAGGGGVEGAIAGSYTSGTPIDGRLTLTDPVTGEPITDAAVTTSLLGPDGGLVFWGCAIYDEITGEYVFTIDTSGLAPGTYELIIQTDDGQSQTVSIEIQVA